MSIENECCSLENSLRLKEIGIKQESIYYWIQLTHGWKYQLAMMEGFNKKYHEMDMVPAYTATELLAITPRWVDNKIDPPFNNFTFMMDIRRIVEDKELVRFYCINYYCDTIQFESGSPHFNKTLYTHAVMDKKPSDALASNLICLHNQVFLKLYGDSNEKSS